MLRPAQHALIAHHVARHHLVGRRVGCTWVLAPDGRLVGVVVAVEGRWAWILGEDGRTYARPIRCLMVEEVE